MPITIGMLIDCPSLIRELLPPPKVCSCGCGKTFDSIEDIDEKFYGPKGRIRADCAYEQLGEAIEEHPIVSASIRRG